MQILNQFARVRAKRVRYNHGLLRAMLNRPVRSVKQIMSVPKGLNCLRRTQIYSRAVSLQIKE